MRLRLASLDPQPNLNTKSSYFIDVPEIEKTKGLSK